MHQIAICKGLPDLAETTLRFFRQLGVEEVGLPTRPGAYARPLVPPAQTGPTGPQPAAWSVAALTELCERVAAIGLRATTVDLPLSGNILLGRPGAEADTEMACASIQAAGAAGLRVVTYNFTALRASEGYYARPGAGRGGADLRAFNYERVRHLPPLASIGEHTREAMWARLTRFLELAVPVAAAAGVRLAVHPNDPPVPVFRGVAQPLSTLADLKRLVAAVDSPANSVFFDTGVLTEMGESAPEAIRYFGTRDRIGLVHFRNVRVEVPTYRYTETFLDDGECDMAACMEALHAVGYAGGIDPDHTPAISDDREDRAGWALAIGQMIGLRAAAERVLSAER